MKKFGIALLVIVLAVAIGAGVGIYFTHNHSNSKPAISAKEAEEIALEDAGLNNKEVTGLHSHLDIEEAHPYYDIQFVVKDKDHKTLLYEYEIDSENGKIISKEQEQKGSVDKNTNPQQDNEIVADKAKEIALKHAGVNEADTLYIDIEYDREEKGNEWNVDFETTTTEYDYEISATDGRILKSSQEPRV